MRQISTEIIIAAVKDAAMRANFELGEDVVLALKAAMAYEESDAGRDILGKLQENADIAREERIPMCQETGVALGVHILMMPCHIASLPLAVNIQCHASRHLEIIL